MNATTIKNLFLAYFARKYTERSTWIGIVAGLASAAHFTLSADATGHIADTCVAIVGLAFFLYNERRAPTADAGGVQADHPAVAGSGDAVPHLPTVARADLPPAERGNDTEQPHAVRPGFTK